MPILNNTPFFIPPPSGWNITNFSYDNKSVSISGQETNSTGLAFKSDGTKMFVVGIDADTLFQYSLGVAWDVSTAVYDNVSFLLTGSNSAPRDVVFNSSGTKFYIPEAFSDTIREYTMTTPWDISTSSFTVAFSYATQTTSSINGIAFKTDGTRMFLLGEINTSVFEYALSTPYDISTSSFIQAGIDVVSEDSIPRGLIFKPDGKLMFVLGDENNKIFQYSLTTPWNTNSASYDNLFFDLSGQETLPQALAVKADGFKAYVTGRGNDTVYQYTFA